MTIRQVKYLNNVLEPDRRAVKRGMRPLLEIKPLATAQGPLVGLNACPFERRTAMLAHLGMNVRDLAQAKAYYDVLMPLLGFEPYLTAADQFAYCPAGGKPGTYLFFYPALEVGDYSRHRPGLQHLAFRVLSRAAVHTVYETVQAMGSPIIHPPQALPQYLPHYYAVFWEGPEGFMLEAVCLREE